MIHGYSRSSVYHLYNKWKPERNLDGIEAAIKSGTFNSHFRGKSKVNSARLGPIYRILDHNPMLHSREVADILEKDPKCKRIDSDGN